LKRIWHFNKNSSIVNPRITKITRKLKMQQSPFTSDMPLSIENAHALPMSDEIITHIEDLPDGSSVYEIGQGMSEGADKATLRFNENLAENMPDSVLSGIAANIMSGIDQDKESRNEWEQAYLKGIKYLGWKLEDFKDVPFMSACRAFDTTLSTAAITFYSRVRPHLFPRCGPADFKIKGEPTQQEEDRRYRIKEYVNYYLTTMDKDYYPENDRLLMYLPIIGCCFRKTYTDPITNLPITRFIDPQDFIVDNNCVSILSSDRLTHKVSLTKQEIKLRQLSGFYRDIDLPGVTQQLEDDSETTKALQYMEGINLNVYEKGNLYDVYESHVMLALDEYDYFEHKSQKVSLPLPYIVTICAQNQTVLSLRRNWKMDDPFFKRREHFTQWNYLPGLGLYGMGLTHLIGSNAVVLTSVLRQLVDAGTLKNFPGGLKVKGLRLENNDKAIGPGEFIDVETGGLSINDAIKPMPYLGADPVLKDLRNEIMQQTQILAATSENQIVENNVNAPVQTTLALLEVVNRTPGAIFEGLYKSLSNELRIMYDLFGEVLPDEPYPFKVPGGETAIMRADFNDNMHIIPIADPQNTTQTQKIFKAKSLQETAIAMPQFYNMREVNKRILEAMRIDNIDEVLVPAPEEAMPLDPISENMSALSGKPIKAALWQDHLSHRATHMGFLSDQNIINNIPETMRPGVVNELMAHIQEHNAMEYLINMQMQMQMQMPDAEMLQDPEIQNAIALKSAQAIQEQMAQQAEQQQAQTIDPNQILMEDIEQRREAALLKDKESKLKAETDIHKSQLKFETEKLKMKTQKEIATGKNEKEKQIAHLKTSHLKHHNR